MQSCKDDDLILTGQPEWLGNSIYERLQDEGNYKYTLRLIDDLDLNHGQRIRCVVQFEQLGCQQV